MRSQGEVYIVLKVFSPLLVVSVLSKKHHDCLYLGTVTIIGPDGEPMCIPQSQIAQVQRGQIKPGPDGTITVLQRFPVLSSRNRNTETLGQRLVSVSEPDSNFQGL